MRTNAIGFITAALLATTVSARDGLLQLADVDTGLSVRFGLGPFDLASDDASIQAPHSPRTLQAVGLERSTRVGYPELPAKGYFFALPPDATVSLVIEDASFHDVADVWLEPSRTTRVADDARGEPVYASIPDPVAYATDAWIPSSVATVVARGVARDVDYVQVEVAPFQWNPVTGVLRVHDQISFRLDYPTLQSEGAAAEPESGRTDSPGGSRMRAPRSGEAAGRSRHSDAGSGPGAVAKGEPASTDPFFVNGPVPRSWRKPRVADDIEKIESSLNPTATLDGAYKIAVDTDGVYRLPFSSFQSAGLAPTSFSDLRLENRGRRVPFEAVDDGDAQFGPGDFIQFHGFANTERWTTTETYWLSATKLGQRMRTVAAFPDGSASYPSFGSSKVTVRNEQNEQFFGQSPLDPDDWEPWVFEDDLETWEGDRCKSSAIPTMDFEVNLDQLARPRTGTSYEVRGILVGQPLTNCNPQRRSIDVRLNGGPVTTLDWSWEFNKKSMVHPFQVSFDPSILVPGTNTITLEQNSLTDSLIVTSVDYVELEYERRLHAEAGEVAIDGRFNSGAVFYLSGFADADVEIIDLRSDTSVHRIVGPKTLSAGPGMPSTLSFAVAPSEVFHQIRVVARSALRTAPVIKDTPSDLCAPQAASYIAVAHPDFVEATRAITDWHATNSGFDTKLVDLTNVYDEFSYGNVHNDAIRDFFACTFSRWTEKPLYALIVGDSINDPKDYRGRGFPQYMPHGDYTRQGAANRFDFLLPSDSHYTRFVGGPDDYVPDMLLGRLAVQDAIEVTRYAGKIDRYSKSAPAPWNKKNLFVVDDEIFDATPPCDPALNPSEEHMQDMLCCYLGGADPADVNLVMEDLEVWPIGHDLIIDEHNSGISMMMYVGHGSVYDLGQKCDASFEYIYGSDDVSLLTNDTALPIFASVSCNVGRFEATNNLDETRCMGEVFTGMSNVGYIAFIAQGTTTTTGEGEAQVRGMLDGLYEPNSQHLPPFAVPDKRERVGAIHFASQMGILNNPSIGDARRFDNSVTLMLMGDPAVRLKIPEVPLGDRGLCSAWANCP